tara:strand:+ start:1023 stop:1865 length:843 start_codon:yes stop_codon:yes gene_type:complete
MLRVNLWDSAFSHLANSEGSYSMVHKKIPNNIRYDCKLTNYDGVTIFTDSFCNRSAISNVDSKLKIGWLLENRSLVPNAYNNIASYIDLLDFVFTNDEILLKNYPKKAKFVPFGGAWVKKENFGLHKKTKLVSIIYSHKKGPHEGYRLRHDLANRYSHILDLFGNGSPNPIEYKEEALVDYMFTIVIENVSDKNYFTEKIIDPLLTGTIPIYWGCPNIDNYFNMSGFINLDVENIDSILNSLDGELYDSMISIASKNYNEALNYEITEDWIYNNILKEIL